MEAADHYRREQEEALSLANDKMHNTSTSNNAELQHTFVHKCRNHGRAWDEGVV